MSFDEGGYVSSTDKLYANLEYEILIAKAVDRCLHYRVIAPNNEFLDAVRALYLSLVDIPGKPLRTSAKEQYDIVMGRDDTNVHKMEIFFSTITDILSKYHMLFRSTTVEVGRENINLR
jgi:hypothetical protein